MGKNSLFKNVETDRFLLIGFFDIQYQSNTNIIFFHKKCSSIFINSSWRWIHLLVFVMRTSHNSNKKKEDNHSSSFFIKLFYTFLCLTMALFEFFTTTTRTWFVSTYFLIHSLESLWFRTLCLSCILSSSLSTHIFFSTIRLCFT